MNEDAFRDIPLDQIAIRENYRKTFKDTSLKELAQSIKENGVIEPMSGEAQRLAGNGFLTKPVAMLISRLANEEDQEKMANDLARTHRQKQVDIRYAREYVEKKIEANGRPRTRRNGIQKANGNDYCANWKKYLVQFSALQFEYFKSVVRGRTDTPTLAEAVERVMIEKGK
jgi:hypothetical protein